MVFEVILEQVGVSTDSRPLIEHVYEDCVNT